MLATLTTLAHKALAESTSSRKARFIFQSACWGLRYAAMAYSSNLNYPFQPNFHKWARPAYEQGALPTLSIPPGEVAIKVLPGDKMYQAMEIEPNFMRPIILHGFPDPLTRSCPMMPWRTHQSGT